MDLGGYSLAHVEGFVLALFRVSALIMFAPVIGGQTVPKLVKIGLALTTTLVVFPFVKSCPKDMPPTIAAFLVAVVKEVSIGLVLGYALRLAFEGIQIAGQIIGFEMGFGIVNVIDPQSNLQVSIIGQFFYTMAVMIFLAMDGHHAILRGIGLSFDVAPIGRVRLPASVADKLVRMSGEMFTIAVQVSAAAMTLLVLNKIAVGLVARTVPQMNVLVVGFPLDITVGLLGVGLSMSVFGNVMQRLVTACARDIVFLIHRMQ